MKAALLKPLLITHIVLLLMTALSPAPIVTAGAVLIAIGDTLLLLSIGKGGGHE